MSTNKLFISWTDAKLDFGAVGDGIIDDTSALLKALSSTNSTKKPLFIPPGVYRVTQTLILAAPNPGSPIQIRVLGTSNTTLKWDGVAGGTILNLNGLTYSRIGKLKFDGNDGKAGIAIDQSWDGLNGGAFDTGNEYADIIFQDVGIGIQAGSLGQGAAEGSVNRCQFINCGVGFVTKNYNALDWFLWYCVFNNCKIGATNDAGGFHVFNCIFSSSTQADIKVSSASYLSCRNNYSINSKVFLHAIFQGYNDAVITIQKNTIIDSINESSIVLQGFGPIILLDNTIRSRPGTTNSVVDFGVYLDSTFVPAELFSIGNNFTATSKIGMRSGKLISIDDIVVSSHDIISSPPPLQPEWSKFENIIEISAGTTRDIIQSTIDLVSKIHNKSFTIHFETGKYLITSPLTIPANLDITLVGDGFSTLFYSVGSFQDPLIHLQGPSKATLTDFAITGDNKDLDGSGILIDEADQVGARVFVDQVFLRNGKYNLLVNGLDHTNLQLHNLYHQGGYYNGDPQCVSVNVIGGVGAAQDKLIEGRTNLFSGASSDNIITYSVSAGGKLLVRDIWYETTATPGFVKLTGKGTFTHNNGKMATVVGQATPAIDIQGFNGKVSILGGLIHDRVSVTGDGSKTKVLALGQEQNYNNANYLVDTTSPPAKAVLRNSRGYSSQGCVQIADQGTSTLLDDTNPEAQAFLKEMVRHTREENPDLLTEKPAGVTDVKIYRVLVQCNRTGIEIRS